MSRRRSTLVLTAVVLSLSLVGSPVVWAQDATDAYLNLLRDAMNQQRLLVNNPRPLALMDARAIYAAAF